MSNDRPDPSPSTPGAPTAPRPRRGLEGRVIGGRYLVTRTVAAGANTLIAAATDTELNRPVTVKLVRPELSESEDFRRRFRKEIEIIAGVSHPNIAATYDWGEERIGKRATVYTVGEYLTGGSLRDLFDRGRFLTASQALMVGLEACRGLDFAHQHGLVHTELTPSKLVFGDDRRLRIVDFGLARILGERDWQEHERVPAHVARYSSPEQAQGLPVDGKSDVYSLTLILIEAVTGSVPFTADSTVSTLSARVGKLMKVDADLGPLASVLERAGRPEAAERASAAQFGRSLVQAAPKMARPGPIPTLTATLFSEDPATMRRPNDPTGGIERPPADPEPMLVAPIDPTVSPNDVTSEIGTPAGTESVEHDASTPAADAGAAATSETATAVNGAPAASGDLADLVGRTPTPPAPTVARDTARRGANESAAAAATMSRKERKAKKKADKQADTLAQKQADKPGQQSSETPPGRPAGSIRPVSPAPEPARRRRWVPWLVGLFMLAVLAGLGAIAWVLLRTPTHPVPDVVGLDRDSALALVDGFHWDISFDEERSDDVATPGDVVRTAPSADDDLAEGSPLLIVVSEGPEFRQVPDLSGLSLADAQTQIAALSLGAADPTQEFSETVPAGTVISSSSGEGVPIGGDVLPDSVIDLVVSAGPQQRSVPQLRGLTVAEATQVLSDLGLTAAPGDAVFDTEVAVDEVAAQSPAVGESIDRGGAVTLDVSKGPDFVTFPDLTGAPLPQIRAELEQAGLQVGPILGSTTGTFYAASVDDDQVNSGDQVVRGSTVALIVL